ncbi:cytochrome c family protein [Candidatus Laterigemmans baculatus]|uniref:cytochrome c family protein n=1 Tax=Candidatus Laterigemmans baculatus TaxID=2770505 RepID=UPI001F34BD56|nr:cytochrome c family protein [Candidatus Laterigemmans baculatus]
MSHRKVWFGLALVLAYALLCIRWNRLEAATSIASSAAWRAATPANPNEVLSADACVKCHASEVEVWRRTPHSLTFEELHRKPEAKQIAARLGIRSIKHEDRCVACHYTQQAQPTGHEVISGISCESCHGASRNWLDLHHDYGGEGVTRLSESPAHREQRIAASVAAGMRNPENLYLMAQSCLRCHTVQDETLVNVGGHSAGSLDFEFVSWSQGTIRHNFVRSDGKTNAVSSPERLRVMFIAGMIAELEASLRAVALATEANTYGVNAAKRAARAAARLRSVAAKVESPQVEQVLTVFDGVGLRLGNAEQLTAAAEQIGELGYRFAEQADGKKFQQLDRFIPTSDRWK